MFCSSVRTITRSSRCEVLHPKATMGSGAECEPCMGSGARFQKPLGPKFLRVVVDIRPFMNGQQRYDDNGALGNANSVECRVSQRPSTRDRDGGSQPHHFVDDSIQIRVVAGVDAELQLAQDAR